MKFLERITSFIALLAPAAIALAVPQGVPLEMPESDERVILTDSLVDGGIETQDAHRVAVLMTDAVDVLQTPDPTCEVFMLSVWWCQPGPDGTAVKRCSRMRIPTGCVDEYFFTSPDGPACLGAWCPPGSKLYYLLKAGAGACNDVPAGACVWVEITGPVISTCTGLADCSCFPQLATGVCQMYSHCVDVSSGTYQVPIGCPGGCQ